METKLTQVLYNRVREVICGSSGINLSWNDNITGQTKDGISFVGCIWIYTNKNLKTLKTNSLFACPMHVTLIHLSDTFQRYLIDHGHKLIFFLSIGFQKMNFKDNEDCYIY